VRPPKSSLVAGLLLGGLVAIGCSTIGKNSDPDPHIVTAEDGGEEEVLSGDDEDFDWEDGERKPTTKAGEILVAIGSVVQVLAAAMMPFLIFL
jgi:hypothetical protein